MNNIRNIAIIAHVDHGKTTLVDALLKHVHTKINKDAPQELIMDSNELERERGITIFSKNASVRLADIKINIIDTPGHADFGGEVERVLSMADGALLLVDAKEGPMPQTRFVLKKALAMNLKIIVIINKIDKPDANPSEALNETFDLFLELGASDHIADFPIVYTSSKLGMAGFDADLSKMKDISPVFETIVKEIPPPKSNPDAPLQMLVTTISGDNFKGRIATGRIHSGQIKAGQEVMHINRQGEMKKYRLVSLMTFEGLERIETENAQAGDIIALAGIPDVNIGETIADVNNPVPLPLLKIEEPTVKMIFSVNDSPFAGKEGKFVTSRQIGERLHKELDTDTALRVEDIDPRSWTVSGRGELHLAILIERMRREGYEFQVSRPQVITKEIDGKTHTPFEEVFIEIPDEHSGIVMQKMGERGGRLQDMRTHNGVTHIHFVIATRGLFGYRSEFLTDTRGLGIINAMFLDYEPDPGNWREREQGSLVAHETGTSNSYGLLQVQDRGVIFIDAGVPVYKGQVVGQNSRSQDMSVNVCKAKELTNVRSKGEGVADSVKTPRIMDLEDALEYIGDDELVEVTPQNVRIRKKVLDKLEERRRQMGIKN